MASGLLPRLEPSGICARIEVHVEAAAGHLLSSLQHPPLAYELSLRWVPAEEETCGGPFAVKSCADGAEDKQPPLLLPLRREQLRSLLWMRRREETCETVVGAALYRAAVPVPPLKGLEMQWKVDVEYEVRGGVLADCIGYGKTAGACPTCPVPGRERRDVCVAERLSD